MLVLPFLTLEQHVSISFCLKHDAVFMENYLLTNLRIVYWMGGGGGGLSKAIWAMPGPLFKKGLHLKSKGYHPIHTTSIKLSNPIYYLNTLTVS